MPSMLNRRGTRRLIGCTKGKVEGDELNEHIELIEVEVWTDVFD